MSCLSPFARADFKPLSPSSLHTVVGNGKPLLETLSVRKRMPPSDSTRDKPVFADTSVNLSAVETSFSSEGSSLSKACNQVSIHSD